MAGKRPGLGRGIGALIPTGTTDPQSGESALDVFFPNQEGEGAPDGLVQVPGARLVHLDPAVVIPNAHQPRQVFDPEDLAELVTSIREVGVLQPIVVRPIPNNSTQFELIMGERRLRASKEVGLASIPAIIKDTADENMLRDALLENLHRAQLNPLEEASAYQQLLADFGITQEQLAERIGRSRPQISNTIRLLRLPADVQKKVAAGVLSAGHARAILSLPDEQSMSKLATKIINEDLSVRAAEALAQEGGASSASKPKISAGTRTAHLNEIASRLGDRLNTRVSIKLGSKKGLISIEFATVADLNRILEELGENPFGG
jgi:ParB family chromosome partitioning protein